MEEKRLSYDDWKEITRRKNASPNDVKRLMREYCARVGRNNDLGNWVFEYVADAFTEYLDGRVKTVDKALGLLRPRGHQPSEEIPPKHLAIAVDVARLLLAGKAESPEDAGEQLSLNYNRNKFNWEAGKYELAETSIRDIYLKYHIDALAEILGDPFT